MALGKPSEPVRLYVEDDARMPRRLSAWIKQRIDDISETVLTGQLLEKEYRFMTGQIAGLREALSECEEIAKELE